jgi:tetratricopeptide (TPR) repeat protein
MSNERSANIGNLDMDGFEVNHQWSKSEAFEIAFSNLLKTEMLPSLQYFSFLRPLSELSIAKVFADFGDYHDSFSSCNRAFKIENKLESRWCGDCDKCRFVFLILAPFFNKTALTDIFGTNLLEDKNQRSSFQELLGIQGQKPFECVGEIEESIAALTLLTKHPEWQDSPAVKTLTAQLDISSDKADSYIKKYLAKDEAALMPDRFKKVLDAIT